MTFADLMGAIWTVAALLIVLIVVLAVWGGKR